MYHLITPYVSKLDFDWLTASVFFMCVRSYFTASLVYEQGYALSAMIFAKTYMPVFALN